MSKTTSKKEAPIDFEKSLETLENLVETMEQGDLSLEQSLAAFEQGIKLTKECQNALKNAEQRVQILIAKNGSEQLDPFEPAVES